MRVVMICSGGLDSTILYFHARSQGHDVIPVNFSYGSRHNSIERNRAREIIPGLRELNIDLSFLSSSLLMNGEDVPHGHYAAENMKSTVVPFRNGIMLSYGIAIAENENAEAVMLGSHAGDHTIYPDCRPNFTAAMDLAATRGTFNGVRVLSPFNNLTKAQIVRIGKALGIEKLMARTWTCYEGKEKHCGKCGSCIERKEAFTEAGVVDQTEYFA